MESSGIKSNGNDVNEQGKMQDTTEGIDYISFLPQEILLRIFYLLPFKYWIIMSMVSRQWKYFWTQISSLNLDELEMVGNAIRGVICRPTCSNSPSSSNPNQSLQDSVKEGRRKFAEFVDRVIQFHSGCAMDKFRLSFWYDARDEYAPRVDKWVEFALTTDVKELELKFCEGMPINYFKREGVLLWPNNLPQPYALPPQSSVSVVLQNWTLIFCHLKISSFGQFVSLQRLSLMYVVVHTNSVGDLVSRCPVLEHLSLECCTIPFSFLECEQELKIKRLFFINCKTEKNWVTFPINISTPDLLTLTIVGKNLFPSSVSKATQLVDVTLDFNMMPADYSEGEYLRSLFIDLKHCQALTLSAWCIQVLPVANSLFEQLPVLLDKVKCLRMKVGLVKQELPGIACLLRSCPNLESLTMDIGMPMDVGWDDDENIGPDYSNLEEHNYLEARVPHFHCLENCLKEVKINGLIGTVEHMEMIKFLLKNTAVLESMDILYHEVHSSASLHQRRLLRKRLRRLKASLKLSSQAKVTVHRIKYSDLHIAN